MSELDRICQASRYLATLLRRRPDFADWLVTGGNLYRRYALANLFEDLQHSVRGIDTFERLLVVFREFKQRHFLRIGGRDLLGSANLVETTAQLSDLACVVLQVGLHLLYNHHHDWLRRDEIPQWDRVKDDFDLVVMGMGKLGGQELNYVSDIDLLFLHAPRQEVTGLSPQYLVLVNRLCQWLMRSLSASVEGDRVFLVDLRLRPQGKDGPLVPSLAAAADHYLLHGHPWERQMLLKARPVAGTRSLGAAFLQEVRPFVFRRFLDFQALDELRAMRDRILAEAVPLRRDSQQFDVKLGVGGIREIEFLVQSLQLIYGGRHPELDEPNTLHCLERLHQLGLLSAEVVEELRDAYVFLRRVEHWIQLDQNRQTQKLPRDADALRRLAGALGFEGDDRAFWQQLKDCCSNVHQHFTALFHALGDGRQGPAADAAPDGKADRPPAALENFSPALLSVLQGHLTGFPAFVRETLEGILAHYARIPQSELRERILLRLDRYFGQVQKRPGLVRVFDTSAGWLGDFCRGLLQSELLATLLAHHPGLVEGVATVAGACPDVESWEATSARLLARSDGFEEALEWLRRLTNERLLQVTVADLRGELNQQTVEDRLSALADFVIRHTYERVLRNQQLPQDLPLAVLGLGKLGSREMSYLSDLDLVFVYQPLPGESEERIPGQVVRLIQRFMRMLSTPLAEGPGYAVDARLRPTGNYGPLIVTHRTWLEYYRQQADLWEIQALLRLRRIAGNAQLGARIEEQAGGICYRERKAAAVWARLCHLRQRMQMERAEERPDRLDIKLGMGGLTDIEFLVQGHMLFEGHRCAGLREPSVRAALAAFPAAFPADAVQWREMQAAFGTLRSLEHRLRIYADKATSRVSPDQFECLCALGLWPVPEAGRDIENWQDLLRLRRRVRTFFQHWCPDLKV